jgi:hypothetical protein
MLPHHHHIWRTTSIHNFWKEIAPCDHVVQLYENEEVFMEMLARFVLDGLHKQEGIVLIASDVHRRAVEERLAAEVERLSLMSHYFPVDAHQLLVSIRSGGRLQRRLFMEAIGGLVRQARQTNRKVRVFSEMVTIAWLEGNVADTQVLEGLWTQYCAQDVLGVWHAYPAGSVAAGGEQVMQQICATHSKIIAAADRPDRQLRYRRLDMEKSN